jgi:hypothetical protein
MWPKKGCSGLAKIPKGLVQVSLLEPMNDVMDKSSHGDGITYRAWCEKEAARLRNNGRQASVYERGILCCVVASKVAKKYGCNRCGAPVDRKGARCSDCRTIAPPHRGRKRKAARAAPDDEW